MVLRRTVWGGKQTHESRLSPRPSSLPIARSSRLDGDKNALTLLNIAERPLTLTAIKSARYRQLRLVGSVEYGPCRNTLFTKEDLTVNIIILHVLHYVWVMFIDVHLLLDKTHPTTSYKGAASSRAQMYLQAGRETCPTLTRLPFTIVYTRTA